MNDYDDYEYYGDEFAHVRPRRSWAGRLLLWSLVFVGLCVAIATPVAIVAVRAGAQMFAGTVVAAVVAVAQIAMQPWNEAMTAVQANADVQARLGQPLAFPSIEQSTWVTGATPEDVSFDYVLTGAKTTADVTCTTESDRDRLLLRKIVVQPHDGGGPIVVVDR
jgi:hypothetical protein